MQLVRDNIRALKPYRSARDDFDSGILLDANENSLGAPYEDSEALNRYPMPYQEELRDRIAAFRNLERKHVFTGVGSDEAIDLLFRIFCTPGKDRVLINPPTYGMYKVSAAVNDVAVDEVLLTEDFQLRPEAIMDAVTGQTKMIFICSPNNPTANNMKPEDIIRITESFSGIVIVDEAYIDFSDQAGFAEQIRTYNNLVVLQTLSKSFGLAGIRLGIALADPAVIDLMMKVKAPYNVNKLTSKAAIQAFDHLEKWAEKLENLLELRDDMAAKLINHPAVEEVFPSDANFLLFRMKNAEGMYRALAAKGVVIRYRGNEPHCENCLRISVGTAEENASFFRALDEITGNSA